MGRRAGLIRARRAYDTPAYRRARPRMRGSPCHKCGAPADQVDHVVPLALGGSWGTDNLAPICARCNQSTGAALGNRLRRGEKRRRVETNWRY